MEKLKSSSSSSVANEIFTDFNEYMHTASKMDDRLTHVIQKAAQYQKSLVLVCGNSGDGKSHLIASLKGSGVIDDGFSVYIDATSADKKGMKANDKLREKLMPLSDSEMHDGKTFRLIVAINLGILNDFLKNYENEFSVLKKYVDEQGLFENIPAWKYEKMHKEKVTHEDCYIGHVDFTSFHRYEITPRGLNLDFIRGLLDRIITNDPRNVMRLSFDNGCENCHKRSNCPVYWNYKRIVQDEEYREYIVDVLAEAIIKHNVAPSVREINNFFYEIIIGNTFDEALINANSTGRLVHFINNLSLNLLYESKDGLLKLVAEQDVLNSKDRKYDKELVALNLKPSFEKWLKEEAHKCNNELLQVDADLVFCQANYAREYKSLEAEIKRSIFKYYIRYMDSQNREYDQKYIQFLQYLYAYNTGNEQKCKNLINLIKECVYTWNGRLGDQSGSTIKNAIIYGKGTDRYYLYKVVDIAFQVDKSIEKIDETGEFPNFASSLKFSFALKDKPSIRISIDVDYELYDLLREMNEGYIPTDNDRKQNVNFDSFVRTLLAESESDIYIYSRYEEGKTYRITKDEFGSYAFENEG
ncbi:DNA phosphorothioation-dependent restriction protein DptF [Butyrivibrio sp. VCD2006]|uniref:DNA phosphorothioation-dependent restriction protein DptF n=1 Tax=Butyrivibrio sp. VCD2006 TaxID=1280664 RepID=UPI0018CB70DD|nr:DNA phosphorothioation-dependent restriction protein DptF [Butyrivibrio sp. VCD2006]